MKTLANKIEIFNDAEDVLTAIEQLPMQVNIVSFINAHAYRMACSDNAFKEALLNSDILLRDGIGAKWLMQAYAKDYGYNSNGTDLIPLVLSKFKAKSFCFIGTESPYIDQAVERCKNESVNVVGFLDGFNDTQTMFDFVNKNKADVLILGMGMPRQEKFAEYLKQNYKHSITVINGGAIFDFLAGRFKRAPAIYQRFGIEWLYRLTNEPKRLFNRYIIGIPVFIGLLLKHKIKKR